MQNLVMNRVKAIRESKGLSQEQVGERIGKARGQISRIEQSKGNLTEHWLNLLSHALGCSPAEIISDAVQRQIPVIGEVPGGNIAMAMQSAPEGFIQFSSNRPNLFALRVKGNSMSRIAPDGMYAVVDFDDCDDKSLINQPVIVCIESPVTGEHECSFKIFKRNPDRFEPYSIEPGYDTIFPNDRKWKIYGKVVGAVGFISSDINEIRLVGHAVK